MALNTRISVEAQNEQLDTLAPLLDGGFIRIYTGTQPATPNTAIGAQVLLVELVFGATAFGAAAAGLLTANAIAPALAVATGTATWCRLLKANGTSAIIDGTVDTASANMILDVVAIQAGAQVTISSLTVALPMQGA